MGNELKDCKLYFKMAEDEKNEWKELRKTFAEDITEDITEYISEIKKELKETEYCFNFELSKDLMKQYKKIVGLAPLSKKRTRKLLMSQGFDRDTAQMYADTMKPRNMSKIKELIDIVQGN